MNVTRDFEGCSTLRKYFGQLHYLQSRVPLGLGQETAVPIPGESSKPAIIFPSRILPVVDF